MIEVVFIALVLIAVLYFTFKIWYTLFKVIRALAKVIWEILERLAGRT